MFIFRGGMQYRWWWLNSLVGACFQLNSLERNLRYEEAPPIKPHCNKTPLVKKHENDEEIQYGLAERWGPNSSELLNSNGKPIFEKSLDL